MLFFYVYISCVCKNCKMWIKNLGRNYRDRYIRSDQEKIKIEELSGSIHRPNVYNGYSEKKIYKGTSNNELNKMAAPFCSEITSESQPIIIYINIPKIRQLNFVIVSLGDAEITV